MGDISALKRIRIRNISLEVGDYDLRTALHLAASNGHYDTVVYLCE